MSRPASQPATQGFRSISLGTWLTLIVTLMGLFAVVAIGACNFGYRLGERNTPNSPTPPTLRLQWSGPEGGCWNGFTSVPIDNWLRDGPEPTVCTPVPD